MYVYVYIRTYVPVAHMYVRMYSTNNMLGLYLVRTCMCTPLPLGDLLPVGLPVFRQVSIPFMVLFIYTYTYSMFVYNIL